jgi:predicted metal-dependent peptidase
MPTKSRGKLDDTLAAMFSNPKYTSSYLFYAHMVGQCSIKIREDLPAAAGVSFVNDHYEMYINPEIFDKETLEERLGTIKHEMLHILGGHLTVRFTEVLKKNVLKWNYGSDCAINQQIDQSHIGKNWVTPETLSKFYGFEFPKNLSAEEYYNLLPDDEDDGEPQQGNGDGQPGDSESQQGNGKPQLADSHETWKESKGDTDLQKDITKKMIEKAQEETIKGRGNVPSQTSKWLELFTTKSQIDWRKVLRGITGNKKTSSRRTMKRRDRRAPHREDLRGKIKNRTFNVLVVGDVSGSMSDTALLETFNEVKYICDVTNSASDLIQIDTEAYEPEKISKDTKIVSRKGQGGTLLAPALEKAKEHNIDYQAIVVVTDGGLSSHDVKAFDTEKKRVIWLVEKSGHIMDEMNSKYMKAFKLSGSAKK